MEYKINTTELPSEKELAHLFSQTNWASGRKQQEIAKLLEHMDVFVTLREKSNLIGFGRALSDGVYRALIDDVIVDNAHQKRGLGRIIVTTLLEQLEGVEEIFLNTSPDLDGFYSKFGFKKAKALTMKK